MTQPLKTTVVESLTSDECQGRGVILTLKDGSKIQLGKDHSDGEFLIAVQSVNSATGQMSGILAYRQKDMIGDAFAVLKEPESDELVKVTIDKVISKIEVITE